MDDLLHPGRSTFGERGDEDVGGSRLEGTPAGGMDDHSHMFIRGSELLECRGALALPRRWRHGLWVRRECLTDFLSGFHPVRRSRQDPARRPLPVELWI